VSPAADAAASSAFGFPVTGSTSSFIARYQAGSTHPQARAASVTTALTGSVPPAQVDASTAPPGRSTRRICASAGPGDRWLSRNAATTTSTHPSASGNASTSAQTARGRSRRRWASIPIERSSPITRAPAATATSAAAPVPVPTSATRRPASGTGEASTRRRANGPYTAAALVSHSPASPS